MKKRTFQSISRWRFILLLILVLPLPFILGHNIAQLQIISGQAKGAEFLRRQGDSRHIRYHSIPAYRGLILDRNGEPLAVSTPVSFITADPKVLLSKATPTQIKLLAHELVVSYSQLENKLDYYRNKNWMRLTNDPVTEEKAKDILALKIPGVNVEHEFKRFYPAGEVTANIGGMTNRKDKGIEGIELAYDAWLSGESGELKVQIDNRQHVINHLSKVKEAKPGKDLHLGIDLRVQYAAYRSLKEAVQQNHAKSGSVVVLDAMSGEVLAMANQPSFNPNDRVGLKFDPVRNRAMVDLIEPGSTVKPFTILAALESGEFGVTSKVDTTPGWIKVKNKIFDDPRDFGILNLTEILVKSSQVGTTKIALQLNPYSTHALFQRVGLGESTGSGFPAEATGNLPAHVTWDPVTQATFAFGYGLNVTALQLARAYSVIANNGNRREVSLLRHDQPLEVTRVFDSELVVTVRRMLRMATGINGTGRRAVIEGYSVAGKTGTSHKISSIGGYDESRYTAVFAGLAPAVQPRLVTVVVIDEPNRGLHSGGQVAAPVFSDIMGNALRLLQVKPDMLDGQFSLAKSSDYAELGDDS